MPTVLGGLLNKSSDPVSMGSIFNLIKQTDGSALSNLNGLLSGAGGSSSLMSMGGQFISSLFGNKQNDVGSMISNFSGVKASSALSLLSLAAPLIMSYLGKKTREEGLSQTELTNYLTSQKDSIISAAPAGLSSILGLSSLANLGSNVSSRIESSAYTTRERMDTPVYASEDTTKKSNWLWPLLLALAAVALGIYSLRSCNKPAENAAVTDSISTDIDTAASAVENFADTAASKVKEGWAALGNFFTKKLPNGVELNIPELGVENKLITFLEDNNKAVDKDTWFSFDRLTFETGSATLKPESDEQLKNIAEILKAYPNASIKLGGYTDNTGDAKANLKLSQERAASVKAALEGMGISADRLQAEGYGQEHPVADNSTEEGRAKNRRIDIRVTKK
jgi:outer membrane protein OmpA-like peptidoglycan-associated protein